jgi:hypothetical protein
VVNLRSLAAAMDTIETLDRSASEFLLKTPIVCGSWIVGQAIACFPLAGVGSFGSPRKSFVNNSARTPLTRSGLSNAPRVSIEKVSEEKNERKRHIRTVEEVDRGTAGG